MRKRIFALFMVLCLMAPTFFGIGVLGSGTVKETRTQLITACVFLWKDSSGRWQYNKEPQSPGGIRYTWAVSPTELTGCADKAQIANVRFYNNMAFDPDFNFRDPLFAWNRNEAYSPDQNEYLKNYYNNSLYALTASTPKYDSKTGKVQFQYFGTPLKDDNSRIDIKKKLAVSYEAGVAEVYARMGVTAEEAKTSFPSVVKAMEELYPRGGQASSVEGYLYFAPFIVQYDVIPDDPILPLMPPKVKVNCSTTSAFIGMNTTVSGSVQNVNTYPVIMRYTATANGTKFFSGAKVMQPGEILPLNPSFKVPAGTRPGFVYSFQITGTNIAVSEGPPDRYRYSYFDGKRGRLDFSQKDWNQFLGQYDGSTRRSMQKDARAYDDPIWVDYMSKHAQDSITSAWYRTDTEWKSAASNICKRSAVPQPKAQVDHGLKPSVIVDENQE